MPLVVAFGLDREVGENPTRTRHCDGERPASHWRKPGRAGSVEPSQETCPGGYPGLSSRVGKQGLAWQYAAPKTRGGVFFIRSGGPVVRKGVSTGHVPCTCKDTGANGKTGLERGRSKDEEDSHNGGAGRHAADDAPRRRPGAGRRRVEPVPERRHSPRDTRHCDTKHQ